MQLSTSGNATFSGTIAASNLSGTNTGDQTLPTLSSLGGAAAAHNHDGRYLRTHTRYSDDLDTINASGVYIWDVSEADDEPTGAGDGLLTIKYWDSTDWATASYQDFHNRTLHIKSKKSGTWQTDWAQVWTTDQLTTTNKSNYDTAYTYSQVGHLPLAGGSLTGALVGGVATFSIVDTLAVTIDEALIKNGKNIDVDSAAAETVITVEGISTYTAAFFDFVIKNGTNVRAGTVYSCHDGTNVEFTETSTVDLGDTSDVSLSVDISGTNMRLRATTTSDSWIVKSLVRAI